MRRVLSASLGGTWVAVLAVVLTTVALPPPLTADATTTCVDGTQRTNLMSRWTPGYTAIVVTPKGRLCAPARVVVSSYVVPTTWNRKGFNSTAVPQQVFDNVEFTVAGTAPVTVALSVPRCGDAQVDLYYPPVVREVDIRGHVRLINGVIFRVGDCQVSPEPAIDTQTLEVTIPVGSLVISTPYTVASPLLLDDVVLSANGAYFGSTWRFDGIVITDMRAGTLGWTATAASSDFVDGASGRIDSQNVGVTDLVIDPVAGNALPGPPGNVALIDNPAAFPPSRPGSPGSQGLGGGVAHPFATAAVGRGSLRLSGLLTVGAPTSTPAGNYVATVTFTVV